MAKSLRKFGLKVEDVSLATRSMRVSGTAAAMEAAFKAGMAIMHSDRDGEYRGRQGALSIPAELKGIVTGVFGLDQRRMAHRKARAAVHASPKTALSPLAPAALEARYNFPPGDGTGQSVAIAEFGGGYFVDDAAAYNKQFKRQPPNIKAISVDAPAYTLQQVLALPTKPRTQALGDSVEVMMDVEIIAGLCPGASITVFFSTFDQRGWVDLLNAVITANPVALSISWGSAEEDPGWSTNAIATINDRLNAARLQGITICVAAGDDGSEATRLRQQPMSIFRFSPFVLGVGGTMLKSRSSVTEVVW